MKYQKILDTVIDFADRGLFDDVYWYIKDFANYELLICIQDYTDVQDVPYDELGNNYNTVIAKIDSSGLTDFFGKTNPLVITKSFKPETEKKRNNTKYDFDDFDLDHINNNKSMMIDPVYVRKIDEAVMLSIMRHPLFSKYSRNTKYHKVQMEKFVESLKTILSKWNTDRDDYYYLYLMSSVKMENKLHYNCFWGIDFEEYDNHVKIIPNTFEDQIFEEMKQFLGNDSELVAKATFLEDKALVSLRETEYAFNQKKFISSEIVTNYHKVMEACASKYWEILAPDVLLYFNSLEIQDNKVYSEMSRRNVQLRSIISHKKKYKMLSIDSIREFNNLLLNTQNFEKALFLPKPLIRILDKESKNFLLLSSSSGVRNILQHTFEKPDENILASAASSCRYVILKLIEMIESVS